MCFDDMITEPGKTISEAIIRDRLRIARERAGLTQGQAAKELGISREWLVDAETGKADVDSQSVVRLAALYKVTCSWLAGYTPDVDLSHVKGVELLTAEEKGLVRSIVQSMRESSGLNHA